MTDEEKLEESYYETLGLGPSKKYRGKFNQYSHRQKMSFYHRKFSRLSSSEKSDLLNRGKAHTKINNSLIATNKARLEKNQPTYPAKFHVFNRPTRDDRGRIQLGFNDFHEKFRSEFGRKGYQASLDDKGAVREIWKGQTVSVVRDSKGRIKAWLKI